MSRYTKFRNGSHRAVIRVYDEAGNVIGTNEHAGDFKRSLLRASLCSFHPNF
jgi:hypothetical protein